MSDQPRVTRIGQRAIGSGEPVYVIALIGLNHNGRTADARRLIKQADAAGADAVCLPVYRTDSVVSEQADLVPERRDHVGDLARNQRNMLGRFELALEAVDDLASVARERDLDVIAAPRDLESLSHLGSLNLPALLIEAGDLTVQPLLDECAATERPLLLSTGLATQEELDRVVERLREQQPDVQLVPLYQACCYPPEPDELDLRTIPRFANRYDAPTGFLDHTTTHQAAESAVSLGASVIGKYLTTDPDAPGPHHAISMEPESFHAFVQRLRTLETTLGNGEKRMSETEQNTRPFLRRSLAVMNTLDEGETLRKEHLTALRPGDGIPADQLENVVGTRLTKRKNAGEILYEQDVSNDR